MTEYGRIHTDGSRSGGQLVLEPCPVPWCGSSDVKARSFDANHRRHWIECGKCNFKTPQMPSRTKVITLWNTRQPTQSNIFDAGDVQKHTLIVDQDYSSHTVKVKSIDDSQITQGYGVVTAANYTSPIGGGGTGLQAVVIRKGMAACTDRIGGACVVTHGAVGVATQSDALREQLLQECLVKLRDVQGTEAPKQYACNLIKRIERVLQEQSK